MKKFLTLVFALVLFSACAKTETSVPENWALIDVGEFTVQAPAGWTYVPEQGIDSKIGFIEGDGLSLEFDYGMYSGFLDSGTEDNYTVVNDTIDGYDAQIATPKVTGSGLTMVFFERVNDGDRFNLYGRDLNAEQEKMALQIFQTLQFKQ